MKKNTGEVYKHKKINNFIIEDIKLNTYQIYLTLLTKLKKIDEDGNYLTEDKLDRTITITAEEYAQFFDLDLKHTYQILKQAIDELQKATFILEKPKLHELWKISFCAISKYNEGQGSISVTLTEEIVPYLVQVKNNWIRYNIKEIAKFGSLYSVRLYELIKEFKDTGIMVKSVDDLKKIFGVVGKYRQYGDFKNKTFGHAIAEINKYHHFDLKFKELNHRGEVAKFRTKVSNIEFTFNKTVAIKTINRYTGKEKNAYLITR